MLLARVLGSDVRQRKDRVGENKGYTQEQRYGIVAEGSAQGSMLSVEGKFGKIPSPQG